MSDSGSLTRRGAIRRRWTAPDDRLSRVGAFSPSSSAQNDSSDTSSARPRWPRRPTLPTIYVSRFRAETSSIEPSSPLSISHTPVEFLPEPIIPIPISPAPSYHSLMLYTGAGGQPGNDVGGLSRASTASPSSLPDYDKIEGGPPTAYPGYSNYVIPGMEMQTDEEEIWIGLEPFYWITAPFITDPSMPRCPGLQDGSCPIREAHNAGSYYLEQRAPSALLVGVLAHHNVQHVFEGNCPPAAVWAALLRRLTGSENDASEDLLFGFRWWHCEDYRARIIARRQPTLDISQSTVYTRRVNRQILRERVQDAGHEDTQDSDSPRRTMLMASGMPTLVATTGLTPQVLRKTENYLSHTTIAMSEANFPSATLTASLCDTRILSRHLARPTTKKATSTALTSSSPSTSQPRRLITSTGLCRHRKLQ